MNLSELVEKIARSFNLSELLELCVGLDIEYENLSGQNRNDKVIALVNYCKRHRRLEELVEHCEKLRPKESWHFEKSWYSIYLLSEPSFNDKFFQLNRRFWMIAVVTIFLIIGSIAILPSLFTPEDVVSGDALQTPITTHTPTIDSTETPTPDSTEMLTPEIESGEGTIVFAVSTLPAATQITPVETPTIPTPASQMIAKITPLEGEVSEVPLDTLESNNCAGGGGYPGLILRGGRRILFTEMKSFDVNTDFDSEYTYTVSIALLNNEELTEVLAANYIGCHLIGSLVDQGELKLFMKDVDRVGFEEE